MMQMKLNIGFSSQYRIKVFLLSGLIISTCISYSSNIDFYNINTLYGISIREANSVCKDDEGFIWVSSKTGILRLTDDEYRIYQLPYENANILNVKLVFNNSELIAFTNNGQIFLFNKMSDRFELLVNLKKELNSNYINLRVVLSGKNNILWIGSSIGFYKYDNKKFTKVDDGTSEVYSATWFNNHKIIIGKSAGIFLLDINSLKIESIYNNRENPSFLITEFFMDSIKNMLWVATNSDGLLCYNFDKKEFTNLELESIPKQPILAIESLSDSTILIGIDGQGIWELSKNNGIVLNIYKENVDNPASLRGNGVYDIYCEDQKRVWICTYSGGASYFERASPIINQVVHITNNSNSLVNNNINCVIEDRSGKIWMATNNGISCWNVALNQWHSYYANVQEQAQVFLTLCEDNRGRIWAGTYSSGLFILDGNTGKQLAHYSSQVMDSTFITDFVLDIYKDSSGDIWIGGVNGKLVCYNSRNNTFKEYPTHALHVFAELKQDKMLFGCAYGLVESDKNTSEFKILLNGYLITDVLVMEKDIWICTSGNGLIHYNSETLKTENFTIHAGLPSDFINSIAYLDGYLWLGTENGLCRLHPSDKKVVTYSYIHSLSRLSFNRNSQCKLKNGTIAWGTNDGLVIFNPKLIKQSRSTGNIYFQDLKIAGRSIREIPAMKLAEPLNNINELSLKYNQNTLTLELLPIGVAPGSKFSWMLEGLDKDWNQTTNNRVITYTNIPSENFVLKIRLYDNSLSTIITERSMHISIKPPFWGTWWFIIITYLLISSLIYLFIRYYINLNRQLHTEEKVRFFTTLAHDIRTSLTLIKSPIEELTKEKNLSESGSYYLNLSIKQTKRLTEVVTQLMDFQKVDIGKGQFSPALIDLVRLIENRIPMFESMAKSKDIEFTFTTNQTKYVTALDEVMIEKIIDNLVSNAFNYSLQKGKVSINLTCNESKWILEVKDQGIGISRKAQGHLFKEFYRGENAINSKTIGSGIGLLLVKNYVSMHGGQVSCTSQVDVGSVFKITIPRKVITEPDQGNILTGNATFSEISHELTGQTLNNIETGVQKEMRILIVEDNDELRNFILNAIQTEFEVITADDGSKAWKIIQKQMPDLVISDVMMPNMSGFELCQLMKSTYETSHIPIILLTALSNKAEQLHGLGLGADEYLTKPFDMALLVQKVKTIIQNRNAIREKALKLITINNSQPILSNQLNDQFVKKMLEVIRLNMANADFNKNSFAVEMNVSSSLLYKKVKLLTDQSPTDFIKTVRLDYALKLLQSQKYNITEVSELCGFNSIGYFSTVFKKYYGKSPTEIV